MRANATARDVLPLAAALFLAATPGSAQDPQAVPATPAAEDAAAPPQPLEAPGTCAKVWVGREREYEEALRTTPVDHREKLSTGVTGSERLFFVPGSAAASAAWKTLLPGKYAGFQESFRSEVAAYELDKLLELHMVPPTVERKIGSATGAAVLWVEHVERWKPGEDVPGPGRRAWARELVRMKMFDQLCGNVDRNQGNVLFDAGHHLVLIDHSRAFVDTLDMTKFQKYLFVDRPLWDRMQALTIDSVQPALGRWVTRGMLLAMLQRRDRMKAEIDRMVAARGESVWLR